MLASIKSGSHSLVTILLCPQLRLVASHLVSSCLEEANNMKSLPTVFLCLAFVSQLVHARHHKKPKFSIKNADKNWDESPVFNDGIATWTEPGYQSPAYRPSQRYENRPFRAQETRPLPAFENRPFGAQENRPFPAFENRPLQPRENSPPQAQESRPSQAYEDDRPVRAKENRPSQAQERQETPPSQASQANESRPSRDRANQFVDFVLNYFGSMVVSKKLQPLSLLDPPAKKIEFSRDLFGFIYTTGATLHNVSISKGLETISRVGNASVKTVQEGSLFIRILKFTLRLKNVEITSNLSVKMFDVGPDVKFDARTEEIAIRIKVGITTITDSNSIDKDFKIRMHKLSIVDFAPFKFDVHGMWGPFNRILRAASKVLVDVFRRPINKNIERKMKKSLTKLINKGLATPTSRSIIGMALRFLQP